MANLWQDLRYALRQLRKAPGFTFVCVLTLALGIGANTAIFTLVDAVMLKSLPVANPKELYRLGDNNNCCEMTGSQNDGSFVLYSYPLYQELHDHTPEFSELAAFQPFVSDLSVRRSQVSAAAEPSEGEFVSGNYFKMFGIGAFAGRALTPRDDTPNAPPVAVMSYRAWQHRYALDPSVIGSTFVINQVPYTVAGIAPAGFFGDTLRSDPPDFWLPLSTEPLLDRQGSRLHSSELEWLYLMGRLRPTADGRRAQSHLTAEVQQWVWAQGWASASPAQRNEKALVEAARRDVAQQHIRLTPAGGGVDQMQTDYAAGLHLLMTVTGLVLLIACANIANLLLSRGVAARSVTAIQVALGASRRRLIRQILTESILMSVLGGVGALAVAFAGTRVILLFAFRGAHYIPISARPSLPVLGFAFLLSLITGLVFGITPAWITSHADPAEALHGAGRSTQDRSSLPQRSLVVLQIALSAALLIGAGLLTQTLRNLENQPFGFETQGRLIVKVDPKLAGYKTETLPSLYQQLQARLQRVPGVLSASFSGSSPMDGLNWNENVSIAGRSVLSDSEMNASLDRVSAHYFETIGTRLIRGRSIADQNAPSSIHEAVVSQAFASKFFPKEDPIGAHFGFGGPTHSGDYEIVGIVEDAKYVKGQEAAHPMAFLPLATSSGAVDIQAIELQVAGKLQNIEAAVRRTLAEIDPNLTVLDVISMHEQVERNFNQETLIARLTELFGLLALILACVGLYGVTAYSVARRTGEIGIRMALGADRMNVLKLVLQSALVQLGIGLAIGIPVALASGRLLANQLYGVTSYNLPILLMATGILTLCALLAGFIPARRAASIEPVEALRME